MRKIIKIIGILSLVLTFMIACEEPEPPMPTCEREQTGTVKVKNTTGYNLWVDCTYTSTGTNYEKKLSNGATYSYTMDRGRVYIWASFDRSDWMYDTYNLSACEDLVYTWYLDNKKSTERTLYLIVHDNEGNVIDTVEGFEIVTNKSK